MSEVNRDATGPVTAGLFDRLATGDKNAIEDLLIHFKDRLRGQTKKIFSREGRLPDLYQTDDIEQGAVIGLMRAIEQAKPTTARHFMRLAATCVRREITDLARKKRVSEYRPGEAEKHDELLADLKDSAASPSKQAARADIEEKGSSVFRCKRL